MRGWLLAALAATVGGGAALYHSVLVAPRRLELRRRDLALPRLPQSFDGYEILHLSDLHIGSMAPGAEHVLAAARLEADLVVCTGDMVERERVAIPGNHDNKAIRRAHGSTALWTCLRSHGVRILINEAFAIDRSGDRLWIVGVDDPHKGDPDVARAFADVPTNETAVLLAHSPDIALSLPPGRADVVMTGHCHGGQVRTPWGPIITRTRGRYPDVLGLQIIGGTPYLMSGGLGSSVPIRFLCPPEATLWRLRARVR